MNLSNSWNESAHEVKELEFSHGWTTIRKTCICVGDLAIHDDLDGSDNFSISHIPTLTSFMKAVPLDNATEEQLIEWCQKVQQSHVSTWVVLRELTPLTFNDDSERVVKAKTIIQEWCLATGI